MCTSMKVEVDTLANVGLHCLWREAKLSILTNLNVNVGKGSPNERKEEDGVHVDRWGGVHLPMRHL